ncbi:hypothetical protein [Cetobacterium sp.]|jgi:hypothetical protein
MKRDSRKVEIQKYLKSIRVKKIKPIFWRECKKCGLEFRRENIYECIYTSLPFEHTSYSYGCTNCFHSEEYFVKWLQDNDFLYTEEKLQKWFKKLKEMGYGF